MKDLRMISVRALIAMLIKPEFNRAEAMISAESRARIHPLLLEVCKRAYGNIISAGDRLTNFREHFNALPRAVLECSARDQLLPEADFSLLHKRLHSLESETQNLAQSLGQREQECASLHRQLWDLQRSHSWRITAPIRGLVDFFRLAIR